MSVPRLHSVGLQVEPAPPRPCNRGRLTRRQWPSHEPRKSPQARQLRAALRKTLSDCWDARPARPGNAVWAPRATTQNQFASRDRKTVDTEPTGCRRDRREIQTADSWAREREFRRLFHTADEKCGYTLHSFQR